MKFLRLQGSNFQRIGSIDISLADRGLVLVLGDNRDDPSADSNGAGKSSVLALLMWCIWGQVPGGLEDADKVIHREVGKDCLGIVTIIDGEDTIRILRTRGDTKKVKPCTKTNDLVFEVNGESAGLGIRETQEDINQFLGLDFPTFSALMPGSGVNPADMTDAIIKALLERILQTEVFSSCAKSVSKKLTECKAELSELSLKIDNAQKQIDQHTIDWEGLSSILENKETDLCDKKTALLDEMRDLVQACAGKPAAEQAQRALLVEKVVLDKRVEEFKESIVETDKGTAAAVAKYDSRISIMKHDIAATRARLCKFAALGAECDACEQKVPHEHREHCEQSLEGALVSQQVVLTEALKQKSKYQAGRQHLTDLVGVGEVVAIEERTGCAERLRNTNTLVAELARHSDRMGALEASLAEVELEVTLGTSGLRGLMEAKQASIDEIALEAAGFHGEKEQLEKLITAYRFWKDGFGPKGIRSAVLKHVTPLLNNFAAKYSEVLTEGKMVVTFNTQKLINGGKDVKEEFNIQVVQENGADNYKSNSTGEKGRANVVVAFALTDLAALRSTKRIPIRFLDEAFDGLDETGMDAVAALLNKYHDTYESTFVVTHHPALKDHFQNYITLIKENGFTRLEEENNE